MGRLWGQRGKGSDMSPFWCHDAMLFPEEKNVEADWYSSLSLSFLIYKMGLTPARPNFCG